MRREVKAMNSLAPSWSESKHVSSLFVTLLIIIAAQWPLQSTATEGAISAGSDVTFIATADGFPAPTFQWYKNGTIIAGATTSTLLLSAVTLADAAVYHVVGSNHVGSVISPEETLVVRATPTDDTTRKTLDPVGPEVVAPVSGLVNLSVRAPAAAGATGLIVGFVIDGTSTKSVLVRGVGPTLREFGVNDALSDPLLSLYSGGRIATGNDDWNANDNAADIARTSLQVGAFSLASTTLDSALLATLEHGAYTVHLSGKGSSSGVALVEIYDAASFGLNKLVNLSARTYVGTDLDAPTVGFVIGGTAARTVLIRAIGPALSAFGVADTISDPQLELYRGGIRIDQNDNWGGDAPLSSAFAQVGAFALVDKASHDAVLMKTIPPGAYTVVVSGVNGSKGTALIEVYDVSSPNTELAFTTQPASQTVASGSTVTLSVAASGTPVPSVRWYRNGMTWDSWTGPSLTLSSLTANDDGIYTAVASNSSGSVTSAPAILRIK
jgi:hypothetical protein